MKVYKILKVKDSSFNKEVSEFTKLFSNSPEMIGSIDDKYICVRYSPDIYHLKSSEIQEYYKKDKVLPLVMTNYKFLSLILNVTDHKIFKFIDFSFRNENQSEEATLNKEIINEMLEESNHLNQSSDYLKQQDQKIQSIDLIYLPKNDRIRIFSNGEMALGNKFTETDYDLITSLVTSLFTGEIK